MRESWLGTWLVAAAVAFLAGLLLIPIGTLFFGRPTVPASSKAGVTLEDSISEVQGKLLQGDISGLQALATPGGWKQIYSCYDFQVSALGFKGTLSEYFRHCGDAIQSSDPQYIVHTLVGEGKVVVFFDRTMPEGVTVGFCFQEGAWRIAYLSPGEIDPASVFP